MAKKWQEVRAEAKAQGRLDEQKVAEAKRTMRDAERAFRLAQVRKAQARTQAEMAEAMDVSQAAISKLERGELSRTMLGTLESYVEAMGGTLRVTVEFDDQTLTVATGESPESKAVPA